MPDKGESDRPSRAKPFLAHACLGTGGPSVKFEARRTSRSLARLKAHASSGLTHWAFCGARERLVSVNTCGESPKQVPKPRTANVANGPFEAGCVLPFVREQKWDCFWR